MYRSILVAVDDSPQAGKASRKAIELATAFDASLHALYVIDSKFGQTIATKELYEQKGERVLDDVAFEAAQQEVSITRTIVTGHPGEAILEYADDHGVDLIVVGGKEKTTAERFFIGATAEKIVRHAPVSVLVVR